METIPIKYKRHVFVCLNKRDAPRESCSAKDSEKILTELRQHVNSNGLTGTYNITKTLCLGHCNEGPTIAIYPDGKILRKVSMADVPRIIEEYLD
ncbi:(2Fe-2S) ferredoxin domain-containing protein [Candidatus Woesearchaeota archaeon]|nr:(2Fe-2S) ferredoxin domain-containing protein [Candidatus Woesearchaeota archaeon]MBI2130766.1 (2Fe-2S) ferredoxin domain-containing protein [Candidatus Woesearchaeota archaeon]MBI2660958.1 (2Fe-2S) ferredoxin domain-containing protein [Candidatus Woesearchaeota archaeon]